MRVLVYLAAVALVRLLQLLPLPLVAVLGRFAGGLAWWLARRHRRLALDNLALCLGAEKSPSELRTVARENFRRIGENICCAVKTAAMDWPDLRHRVQFTGTEALLPVPTMSPPSAVVALGWFGNIELFARFGQFLPAFKCLTTYRALDQPLLNRLVQSLREGSGCLFFERRRDANALKVAMTPRGIVLGLLADQNAGTHGAPVAFFGHECSTSTAPGVFALRYHFPLFTAVCHRVGLARWCIETGPEIPTRDAQGQPRSTEAIMFDVNTAFEAAIRRDPANWFWPQPRWKSEPLRVAMIAETDAETT
ncbi:MAG TPA: hypothetical protein VI454_11390 [Verrucomicrobiae bacterium]|jgi:KDO2-lipid IV(A) lauroyltransferase